MVLTRSPRFHYLSELRNFFSFGYKTKYKSITIKLGAYSFKSPSLKIIKDFNEDESKIEEILKLCFINSEAMWQDLSFEESNYCIEELQRLDRMFNDEIKSLSKSSRESDKFYTSMLTAHSKYCVDTIEALSKMNQTSVDKLEEFSRPEERVTEIIGNFRKKSYSMIRYLIDALPDDNITELRSYNILRAGEKILSKIYRINTSEIKEPELKLG